MPTLREEIKQTKPWSSLEEEAALNVVRTAELLGYRAASVFDGTDLTPTQYNVLRILRGAGAVGLPCGAIGERMIRRDSDITRLMDRLVAGGLVERSRSEEDRRVVVNTLTPEGRKLLTGLDPQVQAMHRRLLGHLNDTELKALIRGLERAREPLVAKE